MKKFTDSKQTETLISLGFPLPSTVVDLNDCYIVDRYGAQEVECDECNYSIGELIEMLPKQLDNPYKPPLAMEFNGAWRVYYGLPEDYSWEWSIWYEEERNELMDALFDMCVKLKEEGVI